MALKFVSKRLPLFLSLLFLCYSSSAFNITQILSEHEEFSTYTNLLGQTKLADDINKRQSVTLLVVENAAFKPFTGQSDDVVKNVMSLHVILDYLDKQKLQNLDKKTALLTTLFQSTGQAKDKQGFLNVTVSGDGQVAFGSAVSGAELNAKLVKQVTSQPYNISILQVSSLIAPPGIPGGSNSTTKTASSSSSSSDESEAPASQEKSETPAASPPNKKSETPAASPPNKESPEKSPGQAPKPLASRKSPTPSTADSPDESSPTGAKEPSAAESPSDIAPSDSAPSPVGSGPEPSAAGAPGPGADGPAAAAAAAAAASIAGVKMCALALIFASTWSLF